MAIAVPPQIRDLEQLFNATGMWPALNEIEVHPYWHEDALIDFCIARNITVVNYAPLAKATVLADPAVLSVAAAHGVTPAQAVLRWGLQRTGGIVIPRSVNVSCSKRCLRAPDGLQEYST